MNVLINTIVWIAYFLSLYFSIFLLLIYFDKKDFFKREISATKLKNIPLVSILIPAYNEEEAILKTMNSVQNLDYPKNKLQVLVIDDGSKDRTKEIIEDYIKDKPHFSLISHSNRGKAASLNIALEKATGDFFACLDADSLVAPLTLRKMLSLYERENNPNLAIITPAMKVYQPKNVLQKIQWLEYLVIILFARITSQLDSLYVAPGPFSIYRTEIIKELGGFDETNITEDQEIAYRVQQHQYQIKQCFDGYVYTIAPKKIKPFYQQRRRWYLGSISCLHQYRKMVANKKYGDFGLMQMVKNVLGYFLALSGIFLAFYFLLFPFISWIQDLVAIRFNIFPYLKNFQFNFNPIALFGTDFKLVFLIIFLFTIGFLFFYLAHKNANEKMIKFGLIPLIPYFVFYYMIKGTILLLSLLEFSRRKKIKW